MSLEEQLTTFKEIVADLETLEVRCNIPKITFLSYYFTYSIICYYKFLFYLFVILSVLSDRIKGF